MNVIASCGQVSSKDAANMKTMAAKNCQTTAFAFGALVIIGIFSIVVLQSKILKELRRKNHH